MRKEGRKKPTFIFAIIDEYKTGSSGEPGRRLLYCSPLGLTLRQNECLVSNCFISTTATEVGSQKRFRGESHSKELLLLGFLQHFCGFAAVRGGVGWWLYWVLVPVLLMPYHMDFDRREKRVLPVSAADLAPFNFPSKGGSSRSALQGFFSSS